MNLKNNKGITVADISISIIIMLMFTSLIAGLIYNINIISKSVERNTEATYIAQNVLEQAKISQYDEVNNESWIEKMVEQNNKQGYKLEIQVGIPENISEKINNQNEKFYNQNSDIIKKVTAKVLYTVGKENKSVEMSTIITR